jgi:hypothetical protein
MFEREYQKHWAKHIAKQLLYDYLSPEVKNLPPDKWQMKFRANWSLRDVEPEVNLFVKTLADEELEEEKV